VSSTLDTLQYRKLFYLVIGVSSQVLLVNFLFGDMLIYACSSDDTQTSAMNGGNLDSCKRFLEQIPDLSFMLKSSLCLPEKSVGGR